MHRYTLPFRTRREGCLRLGICLSVFTRLQSPRKVGAIHTSLVLCQVFPRKQEWMTQAG